MECKKNSVLKSNFGKGDPKIVKYVKKALFLKLYIFLKKHFFSIPYSI